MCPWVKPIGASPATFGLHNTWEPLIVVQARRLRPGHRDWLRAMPARGGGDLPGRKPQEFIAWLFSCLGALPGDDFHDLYPGTGIVGQAWAYLSAQAFGDRFADGTDDESLVPDLDVSAGAGDDVSSGSAVDVSVSAGNDT